MHFIITMFIGLVAGLASGLFGVGGGILFVPLLVMLKKYDIHLAIGTSLAVIIPTAFIASIRNYQASMIAWDSFIFLILFSMIGGWIGASLSLKLNVILLQRVFAVLLVGIGVKLFFQN